MSMLVARQNTNLRGRNVKERHALPLSALASEKQSIHALAGEFREGMKFI